MITMIDTGLYVDLGLGRSVAGQLHVHGHVHVNSNKDPSLSKTYVRCRHTSVHTASGASDHKCAVLLFQRVLVKVFGQIWEVNRDWSSSQVLQLYLGPHPWSKATASIEVNTVDNRRLHLRTETAKMLTSNKIQVTRKTPSASRTCQLLRPRTYNTCRASSSQSTTSAKDFLADCQQGLGRVRFIVVGDAIMECVAEFSRWSPLRSPAKY